MFQKKNPVQLLRCLSEIGVKCAENAGKMMDFCRKKQLNMPLGCLW